MQLPDCRILLTGATGGIGQPLAERLAQGGARLLLAGRDARQLDALAGRCAASWPIPASACCTSPRVPPARR